MPISTDPSEEKKEEKTDSDSGDMSWLISNSLTITAILLLTLTLILDLSLNLNPNSAILSSKTLTLNPKSLTLHLETLTLGEPLQIISTGDASDNYSFTLHKDKLDEVLSAVPSGVFISVMSVVGAFRTGKSFLLSLLLRYLQNGNPDPGKDWLYHGGSRLSLDKVDNGVNGQGGAAADSEHVDPNEKEKNMACFEWKGGENRMTTGIWIWSKPFIRQAVDGTRVAVLLIDTQGMFDNETSMSLTACIFGLSTLLSSRLVYNVEKRVQEDHLQQLALFSEYGRMALSSQASSCDDSNESSTNSSNVKPFQHVEFLVRDWQHFDDEQEDDINSMRKSMDDYIAQVVKERNVKDLQETREQITACFEKISCFGLCHPGIPVTKKNYDGSLALIDETFLTLVDAYARYAFDETLEPNLVMGRKITAPELREHVVQYTKLFHDGARFPEAKTLLEATALANNYGAKSLSILMYKESMDSLVGIGARNAYISEADFSIHAKTSHDKALAVFDGRATMGRASAIKKFREELEDMIAQECVVYTEVNAGRNPFRDIEYYIVPMGIAAAAFILRWVTDTSCSSWSSTCKVTSEIMGHVYMAIFTILIIISAGRIKGLYQHLRPFIPFQVEAPPSTVKKTQ